MVLAQVETIGDAYMCAGNLLSSQPDHAYRVVEFAKDTIRVAESTLGEEIPLWPMGLDSDALQALIVPSKSANFCSFSRSVDSSLSSP